MNPAKKILLLCFCLHETFSRIEQQQTKDSVVSSSFGEALCNMALENEEWGINT